MAFVVNMLAIGFLCLISYKLGTKPFNKKQLDYGLGLWFGKGIQDYASGRQAPPLNSLNKESRDLAMDWYSAGLHYSRGIQRGEDEGRYQ